jgi:hypothetical protein
VRPAEEVGRAAPPKPSPSATCAGSLSSSSLRTLANPGSIPWIGSVPAPTIRLARYYRRRLHRRKRRLAHPGRLGMRIPPPITDPTYRGIAACRHCITGAKEKLTSLWTWTEDAG